MTPEKLLKIHQCSYLLPDPSGEVVRELVEEVLKLREILTEICYPIDDLDRKSKETVSN